MDPRQIQFFFAVVEHRNLSGAAQALRVSQPTLTRQMQSLEQEFGTPLFNRSSRGMHLTGAGAKLHEGLKGIERQIALLRNDVAATMVEPVGDVAFGIPPSPRSLIGVPLIRRFMQRYRRTTVRVVEETSGELRDLVASGVLDVCVTNANEPLNGIISEELGCEPILLVGPRAAKLSMQRAKPLAEIAELPLILTTRPNSLRLIVETGLNRLGLSANVRLEANTLPLMTDLVRAGLGYTILPGCGVRQALRQKLVSASPIDGLAITWLVAKPKSRSLSVAAERFYELLRETGRDLVQSGCWRPPGR
jgi:LysR family nitrogen assimilation transcriptional regulator